MREAVLAGRIANVPFITGQFFLLFLCIHSSDTAAGGSLDEGTIFALGAWNITYG